MNNRTPSKHMVVVFNPNNDPSVAQMLAAEQAKDPKVRSINCASRMGMITTTAGTFWLDDEGCGSSEPFEKNGCEMSFYRNLEGAIEVFPFANAVFSLEECKACATGEVVRLDEFIGYGRRKDANLAEWEKALA